MVRQSKSPNLFMVLFLAGITAGSLYDESADRLLLSLYRERVHVLHEMLLAEGCTPDLSGFGRGVEATPDLLVEKALYDWYSAMFTECHIEKFQASNFTTPAPTPQPDPNECRIARNLTEYRRRTHRGLNIHDELCDTKEMIRTARPWFRFTGRAGTKMADECVPDYSCGSDAGIWTDDWRLPEEVGVVTAIYGFLSWNNDCRYRSFAMSAMRCSLDDPNDLIYRYDDEQWCDSAFCGMN